MITPAKLEEVKNRIKTASPEQLRQDVGALLSEVEILSKRMTEFTAQVTRSLTTLESNSVILMNENDRLRAVEKSTYFERDACVGLIARLARAQGIAVGICKAEVLQENMDGSRAQQLQNRVVVELPSGQVSWDFLDSEAHLFEALPVYDKPLESQSVHDVYTKVMNPGLDVAAQEV